MDIDKWLDKALKDIKGTDPKVIIEKLEKYGLVEKEKFIENEFIKKT
ncbi:hypothetical protein ACTOJ1_000493 [Shigella flexneri]